MSKFSNTDVQELKKFFALAMQKVSSLPDVKGTDEGFVVLKDSSGGLGLYLYVAGSVVKLFPTTGATAGTTVNQTTIVNNTTVISGGGGTGVAIYLKKQVLIIGTPDAPEAFVTNSGKLGTCDGPTGAYPAFDSSKIYTIDVDGHVYQDCHFYTTAGVVSGGSLTFSIAASLASGAQPPFYADIAIIAVPK